MPLTSEQQRKITNHLSTYLLKNKCPICNGEKWTIDNELIAYPVLDSKYKMIIEGQFYPILMVSCENCFYNLSFDALKLGLL